MIFLIVFKVMQGRCIGDDLKKGLVVTTLALRCDDIESDAPRCSNCRTICRVTRLCKGFNVNLFGSNKGKCVLKKRKLAVDESFRNEICFEIGNKVFVTTNQIICNTK